MSFVSFEDYTLLKIDGISLKKIFSISSKNQKESNLNGLTHVCQ